jgi:hypothetical protein
MRMIEESRAIFGRLDPPFEFERESRDLNRLLLSERASLAATLNAFRARKKAAFLGSLNRFARTDARISELLNQLGGAGCRTKPVAIPNQDRAHFA